MRTIAKLKFPKTFELQGLDPLKLPVKVVYVGETKTFKDLQEAEKEMFSFDVLMGPFADKINDNWCVRFESVAAHDYLSR